jgi:hypothetical protein
LKQEPFLRCECLKGAEEICKFIKEDVNCLGYLVECEELPAWKRNGKGPWRALDIDLMFWLVVQRKKYIGETAQTIINERENR